MQLLVTAQAMVGTSAQECTEQHHRHRKQSDWLWVMTDSKMSISKPAKQFWFSFALQGARRRKLAMGCVLCAGDGATACSSDVHGECSAAEQVQLTAG